MKSEGKEYVLSKSMTTEYNFVIVRDEMVSYEDCMQHVAQTVGEIDHGESLMLCSDQHKRRMPRKISTGTLQSHVFETDYWRVFVGIEKSEGRQRKKSVITKEETILSQKVDQYLEEFVVAELDNGDKEKLYNLRKYDEELEILEGWLINPRVDKHDCLMFDCSIGKEWIEGQNIEMSYEPVDSNRESREPQ